MNDSDTITLRQLTAAAFVAVLSPMVRRFPRALSETAGRSAWLCIPLALLPLGAALGVLRLLYRRQGPGTGFADILCAALGRIPGRLVTGLYGLWLTVYAGFLLRSGAERFISTVYPGAGPGIFCTVMVLLCLPAAAGKLKSLARTAMLFRPVLAVLFPLLALLTLKELQPELLWPPEPGALPSLGIGALQILNLLSAVGFLAFFSDRLEPSPTGRGRPLAWLGATLGILLLMTVSCLGMFGPALTARLRYPFFMLARDLSVLGSLERAEPVIIALWVLSDFVMQSLLLKAAGGSLRFCLGRRPDGPVGVLTLLPGAAALAAALVIPGELTAFEALSETVIPLCNAGMALVLPAAVLGIGLLRRKL